MSVAQRLSEIREQRQLTQGDIARRTGLHPCYISRIENGRSVPSINNLEKITCALEISLKDFFSDGPTICAPIPGRLKGASIGRWKRLEPSKLYGRQLLAVANRLNSRDRKLLLELGKKLASVRKHQAIRNAA